MSTNKLDLKTLLEGNKRSKEIEDKRKFRNLYELENDLSDDEAGDIAMCNEQLQAMENECKSLLEYIDMKAKEAEDAKQQAEAYKRAFEDAQLLAKQQEEQIQASNVVVEARVNADRDARMVAERLAAQQAAVISAQQAAALRAQQQAALAAQQAAAVDQNSRASLKKRLKAANLG